MRVCVMGAGAWGTALTTVLASKPIEVILWANTPDLADEIRRNAENIRYLPGYKLQDKVVIESDPLTASKGIDIMVAAVPGKYLAMAAREFARNLENQTKVVSVVKGIEPEQSLTMSELLSKEWNLDSDKIAVLSGPNFAREVAQKMPTAAVCASESDELSKQIQQLFSNTYFRVYRSKDVKGVELGGALKNVVAIGAGVIEGLGFGDNTKSALVVRGLEEARRLYKALGAQEATLRGLSCLGDMVATCSSPLSRNKRFGYLLGKGKKPDEARDEISPDGQAIEGLESLQGLLLLARKYGIELPITSEIDAVSKGSTTPLRAIRRLMKRELKEE